MTATKDKQRGIDIEYTSVRKGIPFCCWCGARGRILSLGNPLTAPFHHHGSTMRQQRDNSSSKANIPPRAIAARRLRLCDGQREREREIGALVRFRDVLCVCAI